MNRTGWKFLRDMRRHLVCMSLMLGTLAFLSIWFEGIASHESWSNAPKVEATSAPEADVDHETADALMFPR